ncbi:MAG: hypothetical protein E7645_05850 [Ruminococcaceae bacterium]|nr:hypothetical protein [Oscillospiraceae bacterium]
MDQNEHSISRTVGVMKKSGKLWVALGGLALGMAFLLFGGEWQAVFMKEETKSTGAPAHPDGEDIQLSMETYRRAIESRVKEICGRVSGAGEVFAMVNLAGGYEYVYATDQKTNGTGSSYEYIVIGRGEDERVVYLTERVPEILGIGVVCTGGNSTAVRNEITALLSAAFGVGSHKIYVTGGA